MFLKIFGFWILSKHCLRYSSSILQTVSIPSKKKNKNKRNRKETFYGAKEKKYFRNSYMNSLPTFRQFQVIHVNNFHLFLLKFVFKLKPKIFEQRGWLAYGSSKYIGVACTLNPIQGAFYFDSVFLCRNCAYINLLENTRKR